MVGGHARLARRIWPALLAVAVIPAVVAGTVLVTMPATAGLAPPALLFTCPPLPSGVQCTLPATPTASGTLPTPASICRGTYQLQSQWATGFVATVTIHNRGGAPVSGWTVGFTFPGDQRITHSWNGRFVQSGADVTVTNAGWNQLIPPGGSVSFGMYGASTGPQPPPTTFTLNGLPCTAP